MDTVVTSEPDGILLQQYVRDHDPVAFDQLARRYRAMVFSIARRVTQSHHDAEDVAQSCFLELSRKAASIRSSIPAFLHATATRRSIDFLRDKKRRQKYETEAMVERSEVVVPEAPDRSWDEISPEVDQAIDRLPEDLKTFVILYFLRGLTVADMVVETGMNRGMIERRLQVGIRRLRADLGRGKKIVTAGVLAAGLRASSAHAVPATLTAATGRMALAAVLNSPQPPRPKPIWNSWIRPGWRGLAIGLTAAIAGAIGAVRLAGPHQRQIPADPYDRMAELYSNCLPSSDVASFSLHASAMRTDSLAFWRGSQPLFFQWCKNNCHGWLADPDAIVRCYASPNLEDAQQLWTLIDTDNSAPLPVQIELLQGLIISRLATDREIQNGSDNTLEQLTHTLCQSYKQALLGELIPAPRPLLQGADMLKSDQYLDPTGHLKSLILGQQDKLLAFLRPAPVDLDQVQSMLQEAVSSSSPLRALLGDQPVACAVRACVRHNAVVTQGQLLLIVQIAGSNQLLELKQQTPAPAELAGLAPLDTRPPAQRAAEDAALLSPAASAPVGWCRWNDKSFTVVPLDLHPQVYELRKDRWVDPLQAAMCWASAAAATHRDDPRRYTLADCITPQLETELMQKSDAYLRTMQEDLTAFEADPRVALDRARVDALAASWLKQALH